MPANRIEKSKRALILAALSEGAAINSACRMFKVGKTGVLRFIREAGEACEDWHNRNFRDLTVPELEIDEQWSYIGTHKERMSKEEKEAHPELGDSWFWVSLDTASKAIINWRTGKRTAKHAYALAYDLAKRVKGRTQITTDSLNSYPAAIHAAFGDRVDLAQEKKVFQSSLAQGHEWPRYKVDPLVGVEREAIIGKPNLGTATVCHVERLFLTVRQSNKRTARKTLAYSKRADNHALFASVHAFIYNMVRRHETLKEAPAVVLGVIQKRWTLEETVEMIEAYVKRVEDEAFERAFTAQQAGKRRKGMTPWYLDSKSGGPNPPVKRPGIKYDKGALHYNP